MLKYKITIGICDKANEMSIEDKDGNLVKFRDIAEEDQKQILFAFMQSYSHCYQSFQGRDWVHDK